jgi:hypothetical protein
VSRAIACWTLWQSVVGIALACCQWTWEDWYSHFLSRITHRLTWTETLICARSVHAIWRKPNTLLIEQLIKPFCDLKIVIMHANMSAKVYRPGCHISMSYS